MRIQPARTTVAEMREKEAFYKASAEAVNHAARAVATRGGGVSPRKAWISDVADNLGLPVARLGPLLVRMQQAGWVALQRADLRCPDGDAVCQEKRDRSFIETDTAAYHLIEVESSWKENPAWLNRAMAKSFDDLQATYPPEWLPVITAPHATRGGEMAVDFQELGCGAYGCVLATHDPAVVMKLTSDPSEIDFVEMAGPWGWPPGITAYFGTERLEGSYRISKKIPPQPLAILWRESATHVGKIDEPKKVGDGAGVLAVGERKLGTLLMEHVYDTGAPVFKILMTAEDAPELEREAFAVRAKARDAVQLLDPKHPKFEARIGDAIGDGDEAWELAVYIEGYRRVAAAMLESAVAGVGSTLLFYLSHKLVMADLHNGNIGVVERDGSPAWAITDPGNIVVLAQAW